MSMSIGKSVGLIECRRSVDLFQMEETGCFKHPSLTKVHSYNTTVSDNIRSQYPHLEVVKASADIIEDESIDLVLVSGPSDTDKVTIAELLKAGKKVQI